MSQFLTCAWPRTVVVNGFLAVFITEFKIKKNIRVSLN